MRSKKFRLNNPQDIETVNLDDKATIKIKKVNSRTYVFTLMHGDVLIVNMSGTKKNYKNRIEILTGYSNFVCVERVGNAASINIDTEGLTKYCVENGIEAP